MRTFVMGLSTVSDIENASRLQFYLAVKRICCWPSLREGRYTAPSSTLLGFRKLRWERYISFMVLLLLFVGCIRMGLPEFIVPLQARSNDSTSRKTAFLVLSATSAKRETLGHQYVLGILPLTRLSLSRTNDSLVAELSLDLLQNQDYTVYAATENDLPLLAKQVKPDLIFKPTLIDIDLNAFDAFFVRILKSSVTIRGEFFRATGSALTKMGEHLVTRANRQYRRYGFSPALAQLLGQTVREALSETVAYLPSTPAGLEKVPIDNEQMESISSGPLLFVVPPTFENTLSPRFTQFLSQSPEFRAMPPVASEPFGSAQIARIVQRAVAEALDKEDGKVVTVNGKKLSVVMEHELGVWRVDTVIHQIDVTEDGRGTLELDLSLLLSEGARPTKATVLATKRAQIRKEQVSGGWMITLEEATHEMVEQLLDEIGGSKDLSQGAVQGNRLDNET